MYLEQLLHTSHSIVMSKQNGQGHQVRDIKPRTSPGSERMLWPAVPASMRFSLGFGFPGPPRPNSPANLRPSPIFPRDPELEHPTSQDGWNNQNTCSLTAGIAETEKTKFPFSS
jgi:hypothetical protein